MEGEAEMKEEAEESVDCMGDGCSLPTDSAPPLMADSPPPTRYTSPVSRAIQDDDDDGQSSAAAAPSLPTDAFYNLTQTQPMDLSPSCDSLSQASQASSTTSFIASSLPGELEDEEPAPPPPPPPSLPMQGSAAITTTGGAPAMGDEDDDDFLESEDEDDDGGWGGYGKKVTIEYMVDKAGQVASPPKTPPPSQPRQAGTAGLEAMVDVDDSCLEPPLPPSSSSSDGPAAVAAPPSPPSSTQTPSQLPRQSTRPSNAAAIWVCSHCTLHNLTTITACLLCGLARGSRPADALEALQRQRQRQRSTRRIRQRGRAVDEPMAAAAMETDAEAQAAAAVSPSREPPSTRRLPTRSRKRSPPSPSPTGNGAAPAHKRTHVNPPRPPPLPPPLPPSGSTGAAEGDDYDEVPLTRDNYEDLVIALSDGEKAEREEELARSRRQLRPPPPPTSVPFVGIRNQGTTCTPLTLTPDPSLLSCRS